MTKTKKSSRGHIVLGLWIFNILGLVVVSGGMVPLYTSVRAFFISLTPTASATLISTPTQTPNVIPSLTSTPSPTVTFSPTFTQTLTPTYTPTDTPTPTPTPFIFAVIGDYGMNNTAEADVAALIHSWQPEIIITLGDNNLPDGTKVTIDHNIGKYFHDYIYPYTGSYGSGAEYNRFFPCLGNHDWNTKSVQAYLDYFTLPGNERYYDFTWGPVHFFALDSYWREPDGVKADSVQAAWLQQGLAASTSPWNIVYSHYPPYSSGAHGSTLSNQWPFAAWGADAVMSGHDHNYERLLVDGILYFTNGLGGQTRYIFDRALHPQSQFYYDADFGAMRVTATDTEILFEFINRVGELIDSYRLTRP